MHQILFWTIVLQTGGKHYSTKVSVDVITI